MASLLPVAPLGAAETIRVASFNAELGRKGPGLLLRDILKGDDQAAAVARVIAEVSPDIIALQGIDFDAESHALNALADLIAEAGADYPHRFARRPNSGRTTGLDLDGDGRLGGPGDAQGYGEFSGSEGMALLSRFPIIEAEVSDLSTLLWRDLPGAEMPELSAEIIAIQRLSTIAHWIIPVELPEGGRVDVMTFHATPPVFDGPEDRNGLRNADELRLWSALLDGALADVPGGAAPPEGPFVILGDANLDASAGDGRRPVMQEFLARSDIQDPRPESPGGTDAGRPMATADWRAIDVGLMRVDYVWPSQHWRIARSGVHWPAAETPANADAIAASRHRIVWADLVVPETP
nr:endonuclease/exonuclease/phosphatase family protein [Poseidonocella sedimentorum]